MDKKVNGDNMAKKKQAKASAGTEEQIGFHKGALATLAKEREEMLKILQIVEQLMQMHIKGLKDLGVDLEKIAKEAKKQAGAAKKSSKPIEDILK
ncbi:hypothetical protein KY361_03675 [Candidatus Woesearchaeota archaeon]|nr:hypothetical protein [Candidatus Woesearchaeota archaeon]